MDRHLAYRRAAGAARLKLWAISDLHVGFKENRAAIERLAARPEDWLILCGDVGDTPAQLDYALAILGAKFGRLLWVPGNHELWTVPRKTGLRGEARYRELVGICRRRGVVTPEDPYPIWPGEGGPHRLVPLFLFYDYSFRPDSVAIEDAVSWAEAEGVLCSDERLLHADPYPDFGSWCAARCRESELRLEAAARDADLPTILINHYPLKQQLAVLPRIPRFMVWCGTRRTEDWHRRFRASAVVSGHLHIPSSRIVDEVRFEEVSLGYPEQWKRIQAHRGWQLEDHLRQILPRPERDAGDPIRDWLEQLARDGMEPVRADRRAAIQRSRNSPRRWR